MKRVRFIVAVAIVAAIVAIVAVVWVVTTDRGGRWSGAPTVADGTATVSSVSPKKKPGPPVARRSKAPRPGVLDASSDTPAPEPKYEPPFALPDFAAPSSAPQNDSNDFLDPTDPAARDPLTVLPTAKLLRTVSLTEGQRQAVSAFEANFMGTYLTRMEPLRQRDEALGNEYLQRRAAGMPELAPDQNDPVNIFVRESRRAMRALNHDYYLGVAPLLGADYAEQLEKADNGGVSFPGCSCTYGNFHGPDVHIVAYPWSSKAEIERNLPEEIRKNRPKPVTK